MRILVTGGAGFIGSALVRRLVLSGAHSVFNVDKLTYAASKEALAAVAGNPAYSFRACDIGDRKAMTDVFREFRPEAVMHLAAETHVDRSIEGPDLFATTNVLGTLRLLEVTHSYWEALDPAAKARFRFHHVSTDEVFGALRLEDAAFTEASLYDPRSPYSASKAASDHFVRAWGHTYGLPVLITNCSNNYGPYHFPEKLIPLMIIKAMNGEPLPVYGRGENIRDWLYVDDHAEALARVVEQGRPGETYLIGGRAERKNLDVVLAIAALVDELGDPLPAGRPRSELVTYVADRPGHDFRYAMNIGKIERELGWSPKRTFEEGLRETVAWFLANRSWWEGLSKRYRGERLGVVKKSVSA